MELTIPLETLAFIAEKARELAVEVDPETPDEASDAIDDKAGMTGMLVDGADNPAEQELTAAIDALNEDERTELLALLWLGRGDIDIEDWDSALQQARDARDERATRRFLGQPLLADYIEEAVEAHGYSAEDLEPDF